MKLFSRQIHKNPNKRDIGSQFETLACQYLTSQGLKYIDKNVSCRFGEIDLIMQDQHDIVFVEVKYRLNQVYGHAAEMVTYQKSQKLIKTAMIWLKSQSLSIEHTSFRFDVIAIHHNGNDINWIKNAITQG
ncbi:YraN family protein [Vibrio aphrogenes]|uniref:YraN family protein n=1 Tax=Vibrio aphrogenes TaxID=1891186 RepID=UPI000B358E32|nr:YraN family protein [Vibrio aphrogenes]